MVVNTTPNAMNLAVFTGTGFQQYSEGLPSASLDHTCLYRTGLGQNWSTTASIQSPVMTDEPWMFEDVSVTSMISDFPFPLVFGSSNDDAAKSPTMIRLCAQAIVGFTKDEGVQPRRWWRRSLGVGLSRGHLRVRAPEPDLGARTGPLRGPNSVESVDDLDLHLGLPDNLIRDLDLLLLLRLLSLCESAWR